MPKRKKSEDSKDSKGLSVSTKKKSPMITIGVDSSTTNCGIAVFEDGTIVKTCNYQFSGTYDLLKLKKITQTFVEIFDEHSPDMVIMETPAPVRNSKTLTSLNQVAGAIWGVAISKGIFVEKMHNKKTKKILGTKTKEDAINKVRELFNLDVETDHEADAVLTVEAYRIFVENNGE